MRARELPIPAAGDATARKGGRLPPRREVCSQGGTGTLAPRLELPRVVLSQLGKKTPALEFQKNPQSVLDDPQRAGGKRAPSLNETFLCHRANVFTFDEALLA